MSIVFDRKSFPEKAARLLYRGTKPLEAAAAPSGSTDIPSAGDSVALSWFSQDPLVGPPENTTLPSTRIQQVQNPSGLATPRFRVVDPNNTPAQPGKIYQPGEPQFDQMSALASAEKILNIAEQSLGRTIPWGFGAPQLWIYVHRQEEPNSGYTRGDPKSSNPDDQHGRLELDYFDDMMTGQTLESSESADVVSHESTHAITDGVRDLYLESFSADSQAFHEGNADIGAMIQALHDPSVIALVIKQTGGNLDQHNALCDIGEQFGQGMIDDGYTMTPTVSPYIRSAFNNPSQFSDTDWRKLPFMDPNDGPGCEPHSYSRIWSGAWYDSLVNIYNFLRGSDSSLSPEDALQQAGHVMTDAAHRALEFAPVGDMRFGEMALAYLKAVKTDFGTGAIGAAYRKCIEQSFIGRNILSQSDIDGWNKQESAIPSFTLGAVSGDASAQAWLKSNSSDLLKFDPDLSSYLPMLQYKEIYSNRMGETFLSFACNKTITLDAADFSDPDLAQFKNDFAGTSFDVWGGLTLGFDRSGKLFAYTHDDIPQSELTDDKAYMMQLISQGLIQGGSASLRKPPDWSQVPHYKAIKTRGAIVTVDGRRKIRRMETMA